MLLGTGQMFRNSAPPVVYGTLNPSDKATNITLSNGNLTATDTATAAWISVRSQTSHSSGKWYWEWTLGSKGAGEGCCGFGNSSSPLQGGANAFFGTDSNGIGLISNGQVWKNFTPTSVLAAINNGDTCSLAIDIGAQLFWCRKGAGNWNGSGAADPATASGGIALPSGLASGAIFAGISVLNNTDFSTANFGASAFSQTPPSGFTAWG
ncbi:hypothetical protein MesoLj131c_47090 [Mesorhizobium sp. 131-3-5]|uniref:hypothetical protein n=1 Tax=Mesorhizobium sp. 131-3-5 TaxID=2744520 RepID=UPI001927F03E|nr:hypothetical protein [Mesorhizobium sp. 131-3-5]BCH10451.1 hypothetical protein MesoLj131c_47090 [Mesorhizobium sp. 131-3-5]